VNLLTTGVQIDMEYDSILRRMNRPNRKAVFTREPIPLYYQLSNLLKNQILSGELVRGAKLPTEVELTKKFGISRLTIRKAKEKLIQEGMVHSIQGSGSYVTEPEKWQSNPNTIETIDDIVTVGKEMAFKMHDFRLTQNSEEVAEKLKNSKDRFVFRISGVRHYRGKPLSYVIYYLPFEIGSKIRLEKLDENPFILQLEKLADIRITEGLQSFYSGRADRKVAEHLSLRKGSPVLIVESTYFDPDHRPVEYVKTQYRKEYHYCIRVKRT
jgi:GntR family transcriptional regulator